MFNLNIVFYDYENRKYIDDLSNFFIFKVLNIFRSRFFKSQQWEIKFCIYKIGLINSKFKLANEKLT